MSLLDVMKDGESPEIALVGNDGLLDRPVLEPMSGECDQVVKRECDRLLPPVVATGLGTPGFLGHEASFGAVTRGPLDG